jgi:hypothetical protein
MDKFKNLRIYNLVMGIFHLVQAIIMIVLANNFTLPVMTHYLKFNVQAKALLPVEQTAFNLRIGPLVTAFLFLSALAHFMLTLPKVYEWYIKNLEKGVNYARWIEYSFSSSIMIVVISMLVGVYDLSTLIAVFTLNAMMILFGLIMEKFNQLTKVTDWLSFIFGCIAGAVPWVIVALYLFGSGDSNGKAPTFVYWIFFSIFLFFNVFAINMVLQYKKVGKWREYVFGEKAYILLSLIAKSLLAWQVFAGTLRPM